MSAQLVASMLVELERSMIRLVNTLTDDVEPSEREKIRKRCMAAWHGSLLEEISLHKSRCQHLITAGKNAGRKCGKLADGGKLCKSHSHSKKVPSSTPLSLEGSTEKFPTRAEIVAKSDETDSGKYYFHPGTGLLFDKDKKVVGKRGDGKELLPLSPSDIEYCRKQMLQVR